MEETPAAFLMKHRSISIIPRTTTIEEVVNLTVYVASFLVSSTLPPDSLRRQSLIIQACHHRLVSHTGNNLLKNNNITAHYKKCQDF